MKNIETLTQWGLKFPNGHTIWDDVHRPRWDRDENRAGKIREYGIMAVSLQQEIESLPIWISRTVTVNLGLEVTEHDTRDRDAGILFSNRAEVMAKAS